MKTEINTFFVTPYELGRAFGGPEEGGWYYDTGVPSEEFKHLARIFAEEDEAQDYRRSLDRELQIINKREKRYEPSSVLSEGKWLGAMIEETYPALFPRDIPRYE